MSTNPEPAVPRRALLRGAAAAGVLAATGPLTGCALGGGGGGRDSAHGEKSAANPLGVDPAAPLEVVIFNGGLGEEYARNHEVMFQQRHPRAHIRHSATQEIAKTLQPRFVGGDPPDVVNNAGANQIDFNSLVAQGALADLGPLLDAPSLDDPAARVRDTLLPGAVESGTFDGRVLALNYAYTAYGVWYSGRLFADRGWAYPRTWDDMIALCRRIKAAGIAPWAYQGKHPRYLSWPILASAAKLAGPEVLVAIDNLEPNAWKHEAVTAAAEAYRQLVVDRYLLPGSEGMDHVQAQTEWCRGRAAFVSCGSWLENEQRAVTPADFRMTLAPTPSLTTGDRLPFQAVRGTAAESFIVPAKAHNVAGGLEYLRVMLSKAGAADFTRRTSSLTCVRDGAAGVPLTPGLASVTRVLAASGAHTFNFRYGQFYRRLERDLIDAACGEFFAGRLDTAGFTSRCQRAADEIARDDSVKKYRR
ncbi:N-acetylglucosamine transport system substrate-binding protein [Krasilnikovia cinnamomea]|uniref:N-acetylglucosamine transport system substrate-binding protein n=1 Tax=Krasilnikovia cinnamomea TaxID=349313 RepID=A0A4Q7ZSE4_9ACTN|nr:N-acetylglucosamine/diacetylchitobiose ABC transporter substrate-binding protein [Krasilnikovia cinnamomea]RZU53741.1 N-acetylglucosamine transport system substrate-binding protein [Krasilnikovia cinnamomea]